MKQTRNWILFGLAAFVVSAALPFCHMHQATKAYGDKPKDGLKTEAAGPTTPSTPSIRIQPLRIER